MYSFIIKGWERKTMSFIIQPLPQTTISVGHHYHLAG
jgi:hypothetical protein